MYTKIRNINYHYDVSGSENKPAIVFINSLGTDFRIWDSVIKHLGHEFRYIRYDMIGHGLTDCADETYTIDMHAADLAELLDVCGVDKVFACGVSVGGLVAQALCLQKPGLVKAMALSNTGVKIGDDTTWSDRISTIKSHGLRSQADLIMERWFSESFRSDRNSEVSIYRNMLLTTREEGYLSVCSAIKDADFRGRSSGIQVPVICISGGQDQATPENVVLELSQNIPGSRVERFENAGHLPCLEEPMRFAQLLRDHFRTCLQDIDTTQDIYDLGMVVRRSVLGDVHVDRAEKDKSHLDEVFQEFITRGAWGSVWSRNQLTKRERSMLTIALLAALGHHEELAMHIRATENTGASRQDVMEVLLHTGVYAGVPVTNTAIKIAKEVYGAKDKKDS